MRIKIPNNPKGLKGTFFPKLLSIEMNNFSVEMLLPSLFFLVESKGRRRLGRKTDSTLIEDYLEQLRDLDALINFDDVDGRRILNKWAKTSLMEIGRKGRKKTLDQILYLQPLTYLTFKPSFPTQTSRLRNVHYFIYKLLIDALENIEKDQNKAYLIIRSALRTAFAKGISGLPERDAGTKIDGMYDGVTELDIESIFSLRFMDIFPPAEIAHNREITADKPICQGQAIRFMQGFVKFILTYKDRMPARELIHNLQILINFELFIYTLKLIYGTNFLVKNRSFLPQFGFDNGNTLPFIYVDFGENNKSLNREIARQCTSKDIQELSIFFKSNLLLRTLDLITANNPRLRIDYQLEEPHQYLMKLLEKKDDTYVQAAADLILESIKSINLEENNQDDNTIVKEFFERCDFQYLNSVERLVTVLEQAQRNSAGIRLFTWFRDVGGVLSDYGIVKGVINNRNTWAYVMSNDLLWTLVHLAAIEPDNPNKDFPDRIRLVDFLEFLKKRYGILVKEVPQEFDSIDANIAARENLSALQRRLKQMGLFENLSDDYEAQYITPQYRYIRSKEGNNVLQN